MVFDFDHTLYDGDSGGHLVLWLLKRSWLRRIGALLATPVLLPLVAFLPTRRCGISGYLWIGTLGLHGRRELDTLIDRYVAHARKRDSARACCPMALAVLQRHRDAGDRVRGRHRRAAGAGARDPGLRRAPGPAGDRQRCRARSSAAS